MKMEIASQSTEPQYCYACLCNSDEYKLQDFMIKHTQFWQILEVGTIKLCYVCRRIAQHAELFIQNVQNNQILLQNYVGDITTKLKIQETLTYQRRPTTLNYSYLDPINIIDNTNNKIAHRKSVKSKKVSKREKLDADMPTKTVKIEITEDGFESCDANNIVATEFGDNAALNNFIKSEEDIPLRELKTARKRPISTVRNKDRVANKKFKLTKNISKENNQKKSSKMPTKSEIELQNKMYSINKINITEEEYMEERRQQAMEQSYQNCSYKCESCVKGFNFKASYDNHMKRHTDESGLHECRYCKVRMKTEEKLLYHTQCHLIRYKCLLCGVLRACRATMLDHHYTVHKKGEVQLPCPHCHKTFRREMSRKRHIHHKHLTKERARCELCQKTYATREGLKAHMMAVHPKAVSSEIRQYACDECGKVFRTPTTLKTHRLTHVPTREFYCVECDKAFKTEVVLRQHLKITKIHVNAAELPFACDSCEKRFMKQKDLEKHVNTVHLELKPYKCDQCDKSYTCNSALREHRRTAHEGYKKPLKYCCLYCDKSFAGGSTLKAHIRIHTGERPYQCDKCPAQFRQSGALATHNKLIHQRLTRDGLPK